MIALHNVTILFKITDTTLYTLNAHVACFLHFYKEQNVKKVTADVQGYGKSSVTSETFNLTAGRIELSCSLRYLC